MASTKMFVHFGGTVDAFKALANKSSFDNKIVFIKGGNDGKGAAIYTHGEFYTSAHAVEALVSSLKAISGVMVNGDASTLKVATSHDGVLNFSSGDETVAVTMDGPGIKISVSKAFRDRVTAVENSLGVPVANDKGNAAGTAYERIAKLSADVAALGGDQGSIAGQINAAIGALDVTDKAEAGKYVSAVSEVDGKIVVSREDLPVDTLTTGSANGTVAFNGTDVAVKGLGSAAFVDVTPINEHIADTDLHLQEGERATWNATTAAVNAFLGDAVGEGAADVIDTLQEIQSYITGDVAAADALVKRVGANETAIAVLNGEAAGSVKKALADAKAYTDGAIDALDAVVESKDGKLVTVKVTEVNGKITAVNVTDTNVASKADITGAIQALDADKTGTGANGTTVQVVETDGVITSVVVNDDAAVAAANAYADLLFAWEEL
jgi:hypothetical protein